MINITECTLDFKKYLKKLSSIIEMEPKFSFIESKLYDKKRIDDVMCCIEASWPEDYKNYLTKFDTKKLKSPFYYTQLICAIKNKFLFSTDCYLVNYKNSQKAISSLLISIEDDMKFIYSDQSGMF